MKSLIETNTKPTNRNKSEKIKTQYRRKKRLFQKKDKGLQPRLRDDICNVFELFSDRELKCNNPSFEFDTEIVAESLGKWTPIETRQTDIKVSFEFNLKYWNSQIFLKSTNNFESSYFERIVAMGRDAVPYIVNELRKAPTPLVHALDKIYPGVVEYDGYVTLKDACDTWLSILKNIEEN